MSRHTLCTDDVYALGCAKCYTRLADVNNLQLGFYDGPALSIRSGVKGQLGSPRLIPELTNNVVVRYYEEPNVEYQLTKLGKLRCGQCDGPVGAVHERGGSQVVLFKALDTCWLNSSGEAVITTWKISHLRCALADSVGRKLFDPTTQGSAGRTASRTSARVLKANSPVATSEPKETGISPKSAGAKFAVSAAVKASLQESNISRMKTATSAKPAQKKAPFVALPNVLRGNITGWFADREYGFIKLDGAESNVEDYYFHFSDVQCELSQLYRGAPVCFQLQQRGKREVAFAVRGRSNPGTSHTDLYKKRLTPKSMEKLLQGSGDECASALLQTNVDSVLNSREDLSCDEINFRLSLLDHALCSSDSAGGYDIRRGLVSVITDPSKCLLLRMQTVEYLVDEMEAGRATSSETIRTMTMWLRIIHLCYRVAPREAAKMKPSAKIVLKVVSKLGEALGAGMKEQGDQTSSEVSNSIFQVKSPWHCSKDPMVVYRAGRSVVNKLEKVLDFVSNERKELEQQSAGKLQPKTEADGQSVAAPYDLELFRTLSVVPANEELFKPPQWLRANASYFRSEDDCLDLQYRLLREDFVKPLREGISMKNYRKHKPEHLHRFHGVEIEGVQKVKDFDRSIKYRLRFRSRGQEQTFHYWDVSKRFSFGSLLCLSRHNFQKDKPVLFAVIEYSDPRSLAAGRVMVSFEGNQQVDAAELMEELHPKNHQAGDAKRYKYTMVESPTYYEAYVHSLTALQRMTSANLPFSTEIVYGRAPEADKRIPYYVEQLVLNRKRVDFRMFYKGNNKRLRVPLQAELPARLCVLDASQRQAIEHALRHRLAIIQGPPGTGKSYVGTMLINFLVENKAVILQHHRQPEVRQKGDDHGLNLLLLGLTNHAVDHLLISVLEAGITDKVVRLGSRTKDERIEKLTLARQKQELRRQISSFERRSCRRTVKELLQRIAEAFEVIQAPNRLFPSKEQPAMAHIFVEAHNRTMNELTNPPFDEEGNISEELLRLLGLSCDRDLEWQKFEADHPITVTKVESKQDSSRSTGGVKAPKNPYALLGDGGSSNAKDDFDPIRVLAQLEKKTSQPLLDENVLATEDSAGFRVVKNKKKERQRKLQFERLLRAKRQASEAALIAAIKGESPAEESADEESAEYRRVFAEDQAKYLRGVNRLLQNDLQELARQQSLLVRFEAQEAVLSIRSCDIIAATINGATRRQALIEELKPRIVIAEEAGEILEPLLTGVLNASVEHLILIGDHQQLQPKTSDYAIGEHMRLNISLFQRLVERELPYQTLTTQRRMHPLVSEIIRPIYEKLDDFATVKDYPGVKGIAERLWFLTHEVGETTNENLRSKQNPFEAQLLARLANYLLQQSYEPKDIAIITPYLGQVVSIRTIIETGVVQGKLLPGMKNIKVSSIDDVQGEEFLIVLLSLVRSPVSATAEQTTGKAIGFVAKENRINVALSRAKHGMYVVGNFGHFAKHSPLWARIKEQQEKKGRIGPKLELECTPERHSCGEEKRSRNMVSLPSDFDAVRDGGCSKPCTTRREDCGHACASKCHSTPHSLISCLEMCQRGQKRSCGHRCTRACYQCVEGCPPCTVTVEKTLPCGHIRSANCHQDPKEVKCGDTCAKTLRCGHNCTNRCSDSCTVKCKVLVGRDLPCGHSCEAECFQKPASIVCPEPCDFRLPCKHVCPGTCGTCVTTFESTSLQLLSHQLCTAECGRPLICGHACNEPCTKNCPPCELKCERFCGHSKCGKSCGELCTGCAEPCIWSCKHQACELTCAEVCQRGRCEEPCEERLACGCYCLGMCGEVCPQVCKEHQPSTVVFDQYFIEIPLNELEDDQRLIQLECPCKKLVAVEAMDNYMLRSLDGENGIKFPCCMFCKAVLWKYPLRYSATFKRIQDSIDTIKRRTLRAFESRQSVAKSLRDELVKARDRLPEDAPLFLRNWFRLLIDAVLIPERVRRLTGQQLQNIELICQLLLDLEELRKVSLTEFFSDLTVVHSAERVMKLIL